MRKSRKQKNRARRRHARRVGFQQLEQRQVLSATSLAIDLNPSGASSPTELTVVGDLMYFAASNGTNGRELWVTDGTTDGARMVRDIASGSTASSPSNLVALGDTLYFVATDGTNGRELWKSDGTQAGTTMVVDLTPTDTTSSAIDRLTVVGSTLYFTANNGGDGVELWKSDGTANGTMQVADIADGSGSSTPANLTAVGDTLYFTADDGENGRELWKSNGTAGGTVMVKDINPGSSTTTSDSGTTVTPRSSSPGLFTVVDGELYFAAADTTHGAEVWKTDGTAAGTVRLTDIWEGAYNALGSGDQMVAIDGVLYFSANDGEHGAELWKLDTNGSAGAVMVKDVEPGEEGNLNSYSNFTEYNGKLYFSANDGSNGKELWVSDGTTAGTVMVADIHTGSYEAGEDREGAHHSYPYYYTEIDGLLYFSAFQDGTGRELWRTDGTTAGTVLVTDALYGPAAEYPSLLTAFNGTVYYSARDAAGERELYRLVDEDSFNLSISVDGQAVEIPDLVGVETDGTTTGAYYTLSEDGQIFIDGAGQTLGGFFELWRTDAGQAGENADAVLSSTQLMDAVADSTHTVQMFVNGQIVEEFENYVVQDGDDVVLVYTSNPVVSLVTNVGAIVIELFEAETPGTVENFLTYINDGDYLNSVFHRSDPDFVIQGGGFTTDSTTFTDTGQFNQVQSNGQIDNEPGISNLRGTIAMAKLSGNPDSATSQFFVNLSDDNTFLDTEANNAFTVFGRVLSMTTVDDIAGLPVNDVDGDTNAAFNEVPLGANDQLVVVQSIEGYGSLTGVKYLDLDGDGELDATDIVQPGVVVYVDANNNGAFDQGEVSTTTDNDGRYLLQVEPGAYTVRAVLSGGVVTTQAGYSVTVEIGREIADLDFAEQFLGAPTGVDLVDGSDTGVADDDNLTNLNNDSAGSTLSFLVTGVTQGAEVRLYAGDVFIGSATASGDTVTVTTDGATSLADGVHQITATVALSSFESDPSSALAVTVDATAPGAVTTTITDEARVDQQLSVDLDSPDEGAAGVTYSLVGAPAQMTIDPSTGALTWTPTAEQAVPQEFDVVVSDAAGNQSTTSFDLTVLGVIAARSDAYSVAEDSALSILPADGLLKNDGDGSVEGLVVSVVDQPANGTLVVNEDGSFFYSPDADFFGTDTFTYMTTDGTDVSNVAKVTITVNPVQDPPAPVEDSYTLDEDDPLTVDAAAGLLANDVDVDGDTLTAALATGPANGTVTINDDGSFTYTPDDDYSGDDSFTYTVNDGTTTSDPITVSLTINSVNDDPEVGDDPYTVAEDGTLTVDAATGVLANDSDIDSAGLTVSVLTAPANGTLVLNGDGSFTYTPDADFFGEETFTYRAADGDGGAADGTVTITVTAVPDAPDAADDDFEAPNDGTATTLDVLANDVDVDGDTTFTITSVSTGSLGGTVTISADGRSLVYSAPLEGIGDDVFTYTITDADGLTSTATVTVDVFDAGEVTISGFVYIDTDGDGARDAGEVGIPGVLITLIGVDVRGHSVMRSMVTGDDGSYSFAELSSGTYQVSESQPMAHADGDEESSISGATIGDDVLSNLVVSGDSVHTENNFGELPLAAQYISLRWFLASRGDTTDYYREVIASAEEEAGNSDLAATIRDGGSAAQSNTSPGAAVDAYTATEDTALTVSAANGVLANDPDEDDDTLTATVTSSPSNGTLSLSSNGSFTYTPAANFTGEDTFTYRASDGQFTSPEVTVTIVVQDVNDAPVAADDAYETPAGTALTIDAAEGVLDNDTDIDADALAAAIATQPANGTVSLSSDGSFVYTPDAGFEGDDTFTYTLSDPDGDTDTGTVTVTVVADDNEEAEAAALVDSLDAALEETVSWGLAL